MQHNRYSKQVYIAAQKIQQATLHNTCIPMARVFTSYNCEIHISINNLTRIKNNIMKCIDTCTKEPIPKQNGIRF